MMARDWEAEFKALNERERLAFARLGKALYKLGGNSPAVVADELEQANAEWQAAKAARQSLWRSFGPDENRPAKARVSRRRINHVKVINRR
jgi:hypothetical protein